MGVSPAAIGASRLGGWKRPDAPIDKNLEVDPKNLEVDSENLEVDPKNLEVDSKNLGVDPKNLGVDPENLGVDRENLDVVAENPDADEDDFGAVLPQLVHIFVNVCKIFVKSFLSFHNWAKNERLSPTSCV